MGLTAGDFAWADMLSALVAGENLSSEQASSAMDRIMSGESTDAQIAGFLVALRCKGETAEEIAGLVTAMLSAAAKVEIDEPLLDTCGTGGDRAGTINVSTIVAFVCAGAGAKVVKHGNRAISSGCGSADLLEALGVSIDLGPAGVAACVEAAGIGFCFAPRFHPAMRFAAGPRKELSIPTVMNFLGPLANPARARHQMVGVSSAPMAPKLIEVLRLLGSDHALVCYGHDGLDELTTCDDSTIFELAGGEISSYEIAPEDFGLERASREAILGGDAAKNKSAANFVLGGGEGPWRDIVLLNSAAALVAAGRAVDMGEGMEVAREAIDSGRAQRAADLLREASKTAADSEA